MKKNVVLLLSFFLLTGCSQVNLSDNYQEIVTGVLDSDTIFTNEVSIGYEYYLPRGVMLLENNDYNQIFQINGEKVYLYVDIVSYYYKNGLDLSLANSSFYYQKLGDTGYLQIEKESDLYFVKIIYNYSKMETYVREENLSRVIANSMIILNSISYNDVLIEGLIHNSSASTQDISYQLAGPNNKNDFSSYIEEYIVSDEEEVTLPEE